MWVSRNCYGLIASLPALPTGAGAPCAGAPEVAGAPALLGTNLLSFCDCSPPAGFAAFC